MPTTKKARVAMAGLMPGAWPMMMPMQNMMQAMPNMMQAGMPIMPMPNMMPNMMQGEDEDSMSDDEREKKRELDRADKRRLSSKYKTMGGAKTGLLKSHKLEIIEDVTDKQITAARCINLCECTLDKVIFVLTQIGPNTLLADLRVHSKSDIKKTLGREFKRLGRRLDDFSQDMGNIHELADEQGWDSSWDYTLPVTGKKGRASTAPPIAMAREPPQDAMAGAPLQDAMAGAPPQNAMVGAPPQNAMAGAPPQNALATMEMARLYLGS